MTTLNLNPAFVIEKTETILFLLKEEAQLQVDILFNEEFTGFIKKVTNWLGFNVSSTKKDYTHIVDKEVFNILLDIRSAAKLAQLLGEPEVTLHPDDISFIEEHYAKEFSR